MTFATRFSETIFGTPTASCHAFDFESNANAPHVTPDVTSSSGVKTMYTGGSHASSVTAQGTPFGRGYHITSHTAAMAHSDAASYASASQGTAISTSVSHHALPTRSPQALSFPRGFDNAYGAVSAPYSAYREAAGADALSDVSSELSLVDGETSTTAVPSTGDAHRAASSAYFSGATPMRGIQHAISAQSARMQAYTHLARQLRTSAALRPSAHLSRQYIAPAVHAAHTRSRDASAGPSQAQPNPSNVRKSDAYSSPPRAAAAAAAHFPTYDFGLSRARVVAAPSLPQSHAYDPIAQALAWEYSPSDRSTAGGAAATTAASAEVSAAPQSASNVSPARPWSVHRTDSFSRLSAFSAAAISAAAQVVSAEDEQSHERDDASLYNRTSTQPTPQRNRRSAVLPAETAIAAAERQEPGRPLKPMPRVTVQPRVQLKPRQGKGFARCSGLGLT